DDAVNVSPNNFMKARSLNNKVDLRLTLLHLVHLQNNQLEESDHTDDQFLADNFAPRTGNDEEDNRALEHVLDTLLSELDEAAHLARAPAVFFTEGQLLAMASQLSTKYGLKKDEWRDAGRLRERAIYELGIAASLHLPSGVLNEARAKDFYLESLWTPEA